MQSNIAICYFLFFAILLSFGDTVHTIFCKQNCSANVKETLFSKIILVTIFGELCQHIKEFCRCKAALTFSREKQVDKPSSAFFYQANRWSNPITLQFLPLQQSVSFFSFCARLASQLIACKHVFLMITVIDQILKSSYPVEAVGHSIQMDVSGKISQDFSIWPTVRINWKSKCQILRILLILRGTFLSKGRANTESGPWDQCQILKYYTLLTKTRLSNCWPVDCMQSMKG